MSTAILNIVVINCQSKSNLGSQICGVWFYLTIEANSAIPQNAQYSSGSFTEEYVVAISAEGEGAESTSSSSLSVSSSSASCDSSSFSVSLPSSSPRFSASFKASNDLVVVLSGVWDLALRFLTFNTFGRPILDCSYAVTAAYMSFKLVRNCTSLTQ